MNTLSGRYFLEIKPLQLIFFFSKKVPAGVSDEPMEKANKALRTLIVMTVLLAVMFTPIFQSYKSAEALKIEKLEKRL